MRKKDIGRRAGAFGKYLVTLLLSDVSINRKLMIVRGDMVQLFLRPSRAHLALTKHHQVATFNTLRKEFSSIYDKLKEYDISKFTMPLWESFNAELKKAFLPYPPFSFLRHPIIRINMFVTRGGRFLREELAFLEERISKNTLRSLLQEDYVGDPLLSSSRYLTSHNNVHNLYHLVRFLDKTKCSLGQLHTICEWGGGYGNMARIFKRLKSKPCTYIILDTPLFSCLQWLYLSTILGKESVNLLQSPEDTITAEKVNLVPISFLDSHSISGDLFISTWGLSDSSKYSQDYVMTRQWFNSKHILLAYQDSGNDWPDADRVGKLAVKSGAAIEDIEFLPGHHYAFR